MAIELPSKVSIKYDVGEIFENLYIHKHEF